ncbi:MAG: FG-GAP-like repeat-containing protein [bacterium]|nr:FG-GAP-like repeat-containing protein [bacterium]
MNKIIKPFTKLFITGFFLFVFKISYSTPINIFIDNVNPPMNAVSVNRNSDISVVFTQPMNAATMNTSNIKVFGYLRGLLDVAVSYEQATKTLTINPNEEMKIGEEISLTLTDNIMTMGGQRITPFVYKFRVQALGGNGIFSRISGISIVSIQMLLKSGDIDNDGDIDIVGNNIIYKNDGFANFSLGSTLNIEGTPELADFDNDGDLDILIQNGSTVFFYVNDGLGNFIQTYQFTGGVSNFGDLNGDGMLDLASYNPANNLDLTVMKNEDGILVQDTSFNFTEGCLGDYRDKVLIDDYNNDGLLDMMAIDGLTDQFLFQYTLCRNYSLVKNIGAGSFSQNNFYNHTTSGISPWVLSYYDSKSFDYNNDGYVDIVTPELKFTNNGNESFSAATLGFWFVNSANSDFTGDGSLDMAVNISAMNSLFLYTNNGVGNFSAGPQISNYPNSSTNADYDNDGDMDIASINPYTPEIAILLNTDVPSPVELSSFNSAVSTNNITLYWSTSSEKNNSGFDVERSDVNGQTSNVWNKLGFVDGNGNSSAPVSYTFSDRNLPSGKYKYRLKQTDFNGNFEYYNLTNEVVIGVPVKSGLVQNYPNPFNPVTKLGFGISDLGFVTMKVYNSLGKEVMTLINENKQAGYYQATFDGNNLPSGMYFYRLSVDGNVIDTKRMALVK